MKRLLLAAAVVFAACEAPTSDLQKNPVAPQMSAANAGTCMLGGVAYPRGFNENGYNYCARQFVGAADGVDKVLDGKVWGDPTWANDHLVMKWNAEWDRGNDEGWSNPPYDAWENNEWNGVRPDGSGYTEHFKTRWSQACTDGTAGPDVTCIWNQFEVLMDQGTVPDGGHEWWVKAMPAGYGVDR